MKSFSDHLSNHSSLNDRAELSVQKQVEARDAFKNIEKILELNASDVDLVIYLAGSIARGEVGKKSDLDLFIINSNNKPLERLSEVKLLAKIIDINEQLGYPEFSNDGQFLKVYSLPEMLKATGHPRDDHENLFTARMLLLLESKPVYNEVIYNKCLLEIVDNYFRDGRDRADFKIYFLLNDILRYWRTLCLNYEQLRHDQNRPFRKKNSNLKFSRRLTVFSTILPLISGPITTQEEFMELCKHSPLERLAIGLDQLDDKTLLSEFSEILDTYENFLNWKEMEDMQGYFADNKAEIESSAERFSDFFHKILTNEEIDCCYRKLMTN